MRENPSQVCDGPDLPDYVASRLVGERRRRFERHLTTCIGCDSRVRVERALRSSLTEAPQIPAELRAALVALGASGGETPTAYRQLPVVLPGTPPQHRVPKRFATVAATALGVSAFVVWSFSASGPVARPSEAGPPATQPERPSVATPTPIGFTTPGRFDLPAAQRAESTP